MRKGAEGSTLFTYERISQLNKIEIMMFNHIVSHPAEVVDMTIRELASDLHVSTTSVMRFCSKLGCSGFSEFKFKLREYLEGACDVSPESDLAIAADFFERARTGTLSEEVRRAARVINEKELVFFIGVGTSGTMGKYGARYLSNLGKMTFYLGDPFYPIENGDYGNTAVVALSVSGEQRFLFRQVKGLKENGATIISITNSRQCTLAEMSDLNIAYYVPMTLLPGKYNVTTSIPVVYILETLAHEVQALRMGAGA